MRNDTIKFQQRILKFRAWDDKNKKFALNDFYILGECTVFDLTKQYCLENLLDDLIITQFTGVQDKNGKDIYEGDILLTPHGKQLVKWETIWYVLEGGKYRSGCILNSPTASISEIIGNIFENPKLLESLS
jgi:uncharacterized phage protein (TIGR01671 family)